VRKAKLFFESAKHPGCGMNKHGVVLVPRGHEMADPDLWGGVSWEHIPCKSGTYDFQSDITHEAIDCGYTYTFGRMVPDRTWHKPSMETVR
jgi:hypothetical protein